MSKKDTKVVGAALMGTAMAVTAGAVPLALAATPASDAQAPAATAEQAVETVAGAQVKVADVQGEFAYDQTTLTSNDQIKRAFVGADAVQCGGQVAPGESVPADQWQITVGGDVQNEFTATLDELAQKNAISVVMGCACAANGADQRQAANANVTGVTLMSLIGRAGLDADVNTVTFTTADGYSVSLPLSYVKQRYTLIVYDINGEPLESSMGGTNQLWLGGTSAKYFARDITGITFTHEEKVPAAPGTAEAGDTYANAPGIGVTASEA